MTHDELKDQWSRKHRKVFAEMNRVLKAHGFKGQVTGLSMSVPPSMRAAMTEADDCCDEPCKSPPCGVDEVVRICACPDGSGGFRIHRCCVKA